MTAAQLTLRDKNNRKLAIKLGLVAVAFVGFGFALVPMYDVICRALGISGRTSAAPVAATAENTQVDESRWVKVEFLSHTMPGVGLEFKPDQFTMQVHPGAVSHTSYTVRNTSSQTFVGQAIPSVTPAVAAQYFNKIECFCFSQQTFAPGEVRSMPVVFVVNPTIDGNLSTVTLSYTFFEAPKAPA
ncbi:MAG: cytochrome c oxidase assembly protein [Hylemonella sp.]|nr:cytochrome c oxidase assembly protein [Hylemonella sp.]